MKKQIWILVLIVAVIIVGLIIFLPKSKNSADKESIKIGASLPLTGPVSLPGTWALEGMKLAVEKINSQGGVNGRKLELVVEDDVCNAKTGTDTTNKLVNVDNVKLLVVYCGAVMSSAVNVIDGKALTFSISIRTEDLENKYPFLFNLTPSPEKEMSILSKNIYDSGIKKVAIFHQSDFFGETYKNKFKKVFNDLGGEITVEGTLGNLANPDFKTDLIKAREKGTQAIFNSFNPAQFSVILKQAKELGLNVKFFSSWNAENKLLIDTAGNLTEGIIYTYSFKKETDDNNYAIFEKDYKDRYSNIPETNASNGYDGVMIIAKVVEKCNEDVQCLIKETNRIENYQGVSGIITFKNGVADKQTYLKTIKNGQFVPLEN
ncbi:MAG: Extracellular ligand-binding receptor [Candidatus Kuenenbacteria bacterium GW2011_GWA2_42_15]|uniref:Extracellular ligand-binding receptor n=3 Tax=Patescibacteria group TaxID=1783273 RepID=A0A0G0Z0T8_9BACT|nr:MAG: Extracellular ligand-binding receptor [Candidatus Daviesbacteria bacterium GW2011_GWF2_38_6]KKS42379.1 MAG: Extracellular ligand-binding receptor [Candidatus Kuenenbacteria bacterium GW2011_GWA2_42_15]OGG89735.1 MAG: hypothetical protein A3H55_02375 [Candidatus Kuenenbacteria bacterium RIFCSPLOWO2_02_FULL_42_16]